jgi:hypothetical protein
MVYKTHIVSYSYAIEVDFYTTLSNLATPTNKFLKSHCSDLTHPEKKAHHEKRTSKQNGDRNASYGMYIHNHSRKMADYNVSVCKECIGGFPELTLHFLC